MLDVKYLGEKEKMFFFVQVTTILLLAYIQQSSSKDLCIISPITQMYFAHDCRSSLVASYDDVGKYSGVNYHLEVLYKKSAENFYIVCEGLTLQGYLTSEKDRVLRREIWSQLGSPIANRNTTYYVPFEWSASRWFRWDNRESGFVPAIRCSASDLAVVKFSASLKN